ncbi:MAG: dihydrofolate reductase, partial [Muribaculaceae bacterium]|nr:dihydrofolate reductase [Muribaculaceae bacterium]
RFKSLTMGHPVIMGRKTRDSLPKALPGRTNIVISRNPDYSAPDSVTAHSLEEAIGIAKRSEGSEIIFIIGGGQIYEKAFPLLDNLEITHICETPENADTYFPEVSSADWILTEKSDVFETSNGLNYVFESYIRVED